MKVKIFGSALRRLYALTSVNIKLFPTALHSLIGSYLPFNIPIDPPLLHVDLHCH